MDRINSVPEREIERIRRVSAIENSSLDSSHPPTVYRIGFLSKNLNKSKLIKDIDNRMIGIENELGYVKREIEKIVIDNYKNKIC